MARILLILPTTHWKITHHLGRQTENGLLLQEVIPKTMMFGLLISQPKSGRGTP
jgi:hypothetical protein